MNKRYSKYIVPVITIILLMVPFAIFASTDFGISDVDVGLGDNDVKSIATNIISIVLSFLGIIAVGFVIYAGFLWMTAGGNADRVDKAKKILIRAAIGIVIILSSYAIASFVISSISGATGDGTDGTGGTNPPGGGFGGGEANLIIRNWQPYDGATGTARNILVRVYFNKTIDASSVASSDFTFTNTSNNTAVNFNVTVVGSRIDIQPLIACEVEGVDYCLGNTQGYTVSVANGSITSLDNKDLVCTTGCSTDFVTSDYIDVMPPVVSLVNPQDNDTFSVAANVPIEAQATDDRGMVAALTFLADNEEVLPEGTDGAEPWLGLFSTAAYDEGDSIDISAVAEDLSGNIGRSGAVDIRILPEHCFNQTKDADETNIDCGGSCGACLGESCNSSSGVDSCEPNDALCGQGVCNLDCICASAPIITNISPDNGAVGNYITIIGEEFGSSTGQVVFLGSADFGDEIVSSLAGCDTAWSPWQVIVEVPEGVVSGGIKIITNSGSFDTTLDDRGWQGDFTLNETVRPGICGITPEAGTALSTVDIAGTQFDESKDRVVIGGVSVSNSDISLWSNNNITSLVPNLQQGKVSVAVGVGDELSNPVQYEVVPDILVPSISYIEPDNGPVGTYITIHGNNFGYNESNVLVNFVNNSTTIPADIDFPEMCGDYSVENTEIVVKVPEGVTLGLWNVVVNRDLKDSQPASFDVNEDVLSPGLCLLEPNNGPVGTIIDAYGEGFGSTGQISFFDNIIAAISNWTGIHIGSQVPAAASTGPVQVTSGSGGVSNSINFAVGSCDANSCSVGDECCSDGICREIGLCEQSLGAGEYIWSFTTGQQLPPFIVEEVWPLCDEACINTMIGVKFSNPVDLESLTDISVDVKQCTDENCSAFVTEVGYTENDVPVGYYDDTNYILSINPSANLVPQTYYRVVLKSGSLGIVNTEGGYLENMNYSSSGGEVDSYSWIFRTGVDECTLDNVEVLPDERTITSQEERLNMSAYAYSEPDDCSPRGQMLDPAEFAWTWQSTNVGTATVAGTLNEGIVTPIWGHPADVSIISTADGVSGNAQITVDMDIPRIDNISPDNGMIQADLKTYVTVHGDNFGDEQGSTVVLVGGIEAKIADCSSAWSNTQIVIEMPLSTSTGDRIKIIKTGGDDESDPFTVNSIIRPALCSIDPNYGIEGTSVTLEGYNFGDTQNDGMVFFDQLGVDSISSWSNTKIKASVPANAATGPVTVNVLGNDSNSLVFSLEPYISGLNPDNGAVDSYVTVYGGNFGDEQGSGYVLIGGRRAYLAPCLGSWSNTSIIVQVPSSLSLGNRKVQVITHYGIGSNEVNYEVKDVPANPLLCEVNPNWAANNEQVGLLGDNLGRAPRLSDQIEVDTDLGASYTNSSGNSCMSNNGSYVSGCSNYWVEYQFNFTDSNYYNAWAETSNYSTDLTDQSIYHNVNIYIDGTYAGYFSNIASLDHQFGGVDLGWVNAGVHTIRYYWTNDWCGGCSNGTGDSNIRIYNVGINTGIPTSYPVFTRNYTASTEGWSNSSVLTRIDSEIQSGPVSVIKEVVTGQQCAGFHIGSWCPGGVYEDITENIESNSVDFNKGCVIGTTSSREENYIPTVAANSEAVGTLATDGTYIYGKSWSSYDEYDVVISKIGTGYNNTVLGEDYGDLAIVSSSITMTYHPDGYIYNGYSSDGHSLQRINVATGVVDNSVVITDGLLNRNTGNTYSEARGDNLVTSDGTYIYNLAFGTHACPNNYSSRCYDGFKVRVFDPMNNWKLVREWETTTNGSFYTDGIVADGKYIYAIEWGGLHRIRMMDIQTGEYIAQWISEQGRPTGQGNDIISGQYDWVNDRIWLGDLVDHSRYPGPAYIYKYTSCHDYDVNDIIIEDEGYCGDGLIASGETCDDGNTVSGDGCSNVCEIELSDLQADINYEVGWKYWSSNNWVHVDFRDTYSNPVLILSPVKHEGGDTATFRIKNLSSSGFDFRLQESNSHDDPHCCDKEVYYFVAEAGVYQLEGGITIEAMNTVLDSVTPNYTQLPYDIEFTEVPTTLSQVITSGDGNDPNFDPKGTINYIKTRQNNVSANSFYIALETDTTYSTHVPETVSWLAITQTDGNLNNSLFESKTINNLINNDTSNITFDNSFARPTFFANSLTINDPAPGVLRWIALEPTSVGVRFENDDSSIHATPEDINYLVINLPENIDPPAPDTCGNGEIEAGETCDSCPDDVGECSDSDLCGNFSLDTGEACDISEVGDPILGGQTCDSLEGFSGGNLDCSVNCELITDACVIGNPASNICLNTEISAEFDSLMDQSSFAGNVHFEKVTNTCETGSNIGNACDTDEDCGDGVCDLDVVVSYDLENLPPNDSQYSKLYIYPENGLLDINSEYRATVRGGTSGVQDIEGYTLAADYVWPFYTGDTECLISRVEIEPSSYQFNSADEIVNFTVHGYDENGISVIGDYSWSIQGNADLLNIVGGNTQTVQVSPTDTGNGELSLEASVYASEDSQGVAQAPIDIFMCNIPWNYENKTYNFKTRYCRGEGVNHVYNSGFEMDDNSDLRPDVWFDDIYDEDWQDISLVSSDLEGGGNYAVQINNLQDDRSVGDRTGIASGIIDVKDAIYTLSAQIKGETNGQLAYFGLKFMNENGQALGGNGGYHYPVLNHASISDEWTLYSASFRPSELFTGTEKVQVVFILAGSDELDKHVAWIDNVQLELGSEVSVYEESNLLPSLNISPDAASGDELLNRLFLQSDYNIPDAIGLRVFTNFEHQAPIVWYQDNVTNIGNPATIDVGGYSALQEGRTTYVNAANNSSNNIYTNIFVLSYTDGANATTQDIFTQMYENWTFNSNIDSYYEKQQLARDTKRFENIVQMSEQLDDYYQLNGGYPQLQAGTYLAGTTVSVWDSWNATFGAELGGVPVDPINEHGLCNGAYDPITCWNPDDLRYVCPLNSYVYRYDYVNSDYYLYSNFEYEGVVWKGDFDLTIASNPQCDNVILNNGVMSSISPAQNIE
ncbi:MAG: IPT/TIG domain-containing protein [Candidatus Komeilibacteria bacterium]